MKSLTQDQRCEIADRARRVVRQGRWVGMGPEERALMLGNFGGYLGLYRRIHGDTVVLYSRDEGMHTTGWFKNPDYERCEHLSLSSGRGGQLWTPHCTLDTVEAKQWVLAFFGEDRSLVWTESPKSPEGKRLDVWHFRIFCDEHWQRMLPRGEVYSTEFTEKGWKTWSEVHDGAQGPWGSVHE